MIIPDLTTKKIFLHGRLGQRCGKVWDLAVKSPAEAIRAIEAMEGKIFEYLKKGSDRGVAYRVVIGNENVTDVVELLHEYDDNVKEFHFYPVPRGSGGGILAFIGAIILIIAIIYTGGAAASAAGGWFGGGAAAGFSAGLAGSFAAGSGLVGVFATIGLSMAISGIAQMIIGTPKLGTSSGGLDSNAEDSHPSYYFSGPINTTRQGGPIPIGYGQMIVGSQTISLAIRTQAIAADGTGDLGGGVTGGGGTGTGGTTWTPVNPPAPVIPTYVTPLRYYQNWTYV